MEEEISNTTIEPENDEEETVEDLATNNEAKIDALIDLLTARGLITESEFEEHYNAQFEDDDEEGEDDKDSEESSTSPETVQEKAPASFQPSKVDPKNEPIYETCANNLIVK